MTGLNNLSRGVFLAATVWLAGCAAPAPGAPAVEDAGVAPAAGAASATELRPPEVKNTTAFPNIGLTAGAERPEYVSLGLKVTYRIDAQHQLHILLDGQEPMLGMSHDVANDFRCMSYGGGYNQRTTWYPDTGVFIAGAALHGVRGADGQARRLVRMRDGESGTMIVAGRRAREREYGYLPCVGSKRVSTGVRTNGYVRAGDRLVLKPAGKAGRDVTLVLPPHTHPFVVLDYAEGAARALVPAHIVLLTVDWPGRRAVVQYQATFALAPQVTQATWTGTLSPEYLADHPALRPYNEAALAYLKTCATPTAPMDPCATPSAQLPELLRP